MTMMATRITTDVSRSNWIIPLLIIWISPLVIAFSSQSCILLSQCSRSQSLLLLQDSSQPHQEEARTKLLPDSAYKTILDGRIAVIPNFLPENIVTELRKDAIDLYRDGYFSADALAGYGKEKNTKFDPAKDRTVLKLAQWKRMDIGNTKLRHDKFAGIMANLRADLSSHLNRPNLDRGKSTTMYGKGSTEISYTRFGSGAYLKRHIDEHHEELKGRKGWEKPTRRSVSWLVYLNEPDWDPQQNGGFIRCFQRNVPPSPPVGACDNGDLQLGWLRATKKDPVERPVFLDGRRPGKNGHCALYTMLSSSDDEEMPTAPHYISRNFNPDPILFLSNGEFFAQMLLIDQPELAPRFHFLEPPKSVASAFLAKKTPSEPREDESALDVPPFGGTLVLFDSVSLPHEVLPAFGRERWSTSGWFHEDQQEEAFHNYAQRS